MKLEEKTIGSEKIYDGKIIHVRRDTVQLPDGRQSMREVVDHSGGVCVAALTEDDQLLFVRQFRYPYGEVVVELPAGKIEPGEDPLECGKRELYEETGATAAEWHALGLFCPVGAYSTERIQMYLARGLTFGLEFGENHLDDGEFLESFRLPLKKAVSLVMSGDIVDAKTQIAILKLALYKGIFMA